MNVSAQLSTTIPSWLKNTAKWWGEGQITDVEFIKALQWLVDQKILVIPQTSVSNDQKLPSEITHSVCKHTAPDFVEMTGEYTNGGVPYSQINLKLAIIASNGDVVAMGDGVILNIGSQETKFFDAIANYTGNFQSCAIQIDLKIP